jgi:hypothetical protein
MADERKPTRRPHLFKAIKAYENANALPNDHYARRIVEQYAQSARDALEAEIADCIAQAVQSPSEIEKPVADPAAERPIADPAEPSEAGRGTSVITISEFDVTVETEKPVADQQWPWDADPTLIERQQGVETQRVRSGLENHFCPEEILDLSDRKIVTALKEKGIHATDSTVRRTLDRR